MNPRNEKLAALAEDQAALWAAKLDGSELGAEDRRALDAWLAERPEHRALLSQYCQFSADLERELPALAATGALAPQVAVSAPARRLRLVVFSTALAAAAAIVAGVWVTRPAEESRTAATSVAQRKTIRLADGSVVELNARTSLLVEINGKERHVRMADGEAMFTVTKDKSRPFLVESPAGTVRVTGTVFDVHADSAADLTVTVVEGSVLVSPGQTNAGAVSAPHALGANDQLVFNGDGTRTRTLSAAELDDALAWRRGEVVFESTPLRAALARFGRYHGQTINVAPEIAQLGVGGRFRIDDLDGFLSDIQSFLPVHVTRDESSGAIAVTARPSH